MPEMMARKERMIGTRVDKRLDDLGDGGRSSKAR